MMNIRKGERKGIEDILKQEGVAMDTVIEQVFDACTSAMLGREWYLIQAQDQHMQYNWGPYESEARAKKAFADLVAPNEGMTARITKIYRLDTEC